MTVMTPNKRPDEIRQRISDGCAASDAFQKALEVRKSPRSRAAAYADAKLFVKSGDPDGIRQTEQWKKIYRARLRLYNIEAKASI